MLVLIRFNAIVASLCASVASGIATRPSETAVVVPRRIALEIVVIVAGSVPVPVEVEVLVLVVGLAVEQPTIPKISTQVITRDRTRFIFMTCVLILGIVGCSTANPTT